MPDEVSRIVFRSVSDLNTMKHFPAHTCALAVKNSERVLGVGLTEKDRKTATKRVLRFAERNFK